VDCRLLANSAPIRVELKAPASLLGAASIGRLGESTIPVTGGGQHFSFGAKATWNRSPGSVPEMNNLEPKDSGGGGVQEERSRTARTLFAS
jgi:hypothetical protein